MRLLWGSTALSLVVAALVAEVTPVPLWLAWLCVAFILGSRQIDKIRRSNAILRSRRLVLGDRRLVWEESGRAVVTIERAEVTRITRDDAGFVELFAGSPPQVVLRLGPDSVDRPDDFIRQLAEWTWIEPVSTRWAWVPSEPVLASIGVAVVGLSLSDGPHLWIGWFVLSFLSGIAVYEAWYRRVGRRRRAPNPGELRTRADGA